MNLKLFLSTFMLIFIAELGDKTQLAAMARTADSGAKWTVFTAASAALVASTLVAVVFGHLLTKIIPEEVIKIVAASLFIVIGGYMLFDTLKARGAEPATVPRILQGRPGGVVSNLVLRWAADFEEAAALDYRDLASREPDPDIKALLLSLADEEDHHLATIRSASSSHPKIRVEHAAADSLLERHDVKHDVAGTDHHTGLDLTHDAHPVLTHAIEHEHATAGFYRELAALALPTDLRATLSSLADHEDQHAARLQAMLEKKHPPQSSTNPSLPQ
jgi:rubrerythrin